MRKDEFPIVDKFVKNNINEVLDKIKRDVFNACSDNYHMPVYKLGCDEIFEIINKYKAESGVSDAVSN